jgi:uncharacterized protein
MDINWVKLLEDLNKNGFAHIKGLLAPTSCSEIIKIYENETKFRKKIVMQNHGYGRGEYSYFNYPLPDIVSALRRDFYQRLALIANDWSTKLGRETRFPEHLEEYTTICHNAGQRLPTPLLLKYGTGDYNHLHQDLYGDHVFPLQMAVLLNCPEKDFTGGEFVLTEQRPRMQSRVTVVALAQGDAVVFAVNDRPYMGAKRISRAKMRHGVSEVKTGTRHTLGVIFHDAT